MRVGASEEAVLRILGDGDERGAICLLFLPCIGWRVSFRLQSWCRLRLLLALKTTEVWNNTYRR